MVPVRRLASVVNGGTPTPEPANWEGDVHWATPVDVGANHGGVVKGTIRTLTEEGLRSGSASVPAGSVVLSTRAPVGYVAQAGVELAFNQGCKGLVPTHDTHSRYLIYALVHSVPAMQAAATGTTFAELSTSGLSAVKVPFWPMEQQRAIADFLDRETTQIDMTIEAQRGLVTRLDERRNAVLWTGVTKGVDAAPVVSSGVPWIGEVPSHWDIHRLKVSVDSIQSGAWGEEPKGDESDIRCVRVADFDRAHRSVADNDATMRALPATDQVRFGLRRGDLLLEKSGGTGLNPVGFVAMYESDEPAVCSNFIGRVRLRKGQVPRFWLYAHAASYLYRLTQRSVKQTTGIQNLDVSSYLNERFPFPPPEEQERIAEHLDHATARMDSMIDAANDTIALMKERRSALISAAVTGRIDPYTGQEYPNVEEAS